MGFLDCARNDMVVFGLVRQPVFSKITIDFNATLYYNNHSNMLF